MKKQNYYYRGIELTPARIEWLAQVRSDYAHRTMIAAYAGGYIWESWESWEAYKKATGFDTLASWICEHWYNMQPSFWALQYLPEFIEQLRKVQG